MDEFRPLDNASLTAWLDAQWEAAKSVEGNVADDETDPFIFSNIVSLRYVFFTQLLGKYADPARDLLCLQRGEAEDAQVEGRWDPRSFCTKVVVPWIQKQQNVLGTSSDPYVNKPLRRPRLDVQMNSLKQVAKWQAMVDIFASVERKGDRTLVEQLLKRCIGSMVRRLQSQELIYPLPLRISLGQLRALLRRFMESASGGLRPLVVATALMKIIGARFSLYTHGDSQGINESDAASSQPGDIMCYGSDGKLILTVEVKDTALSLSAMKSALLKTRAGSLENILFTVPTFVERDREAINAEIAREWTMGANVYYVSLDGLVRCLFIFMEDGWRVKFLREIGQELDRRRAPDRQDWYELLADPSTYA